MTPTRVRSVAQLLSDWPHITPLCVKCNGLRSSDHKVKAKSETIHDHISNVYRNALPTY
jgi:hypothetical protein